MQDRAQGGALPLKFPIMKASRDMPNVCILASTLVTGGAERVAEALARGLGSFGLRPSVACLHAPGPVGEELLELELPFISGLAHGSHDPMAVSRLVRSLRRLDIDLLYCLDHHDALFVGGIASKLAGVRRRVLGIHSTGLWGKASSFTLSDKLVMPLYDKIVALAQPHADYIERVASIESSRISIIHNGVDTDRFKPPDSEGERRLLRGRLGIPDDSFVIVIVAALRPEKNHEMLIRSIRSIPGAPESRLLIVGEGREAQKLHALVEESGLSDRVEFMGGRRDVNEVLAASDLFVLCSHPVVETFPLSLLEAMASGLPVVATRVGSVDEILKDRCHGIVIEPGDEEELTRSIAEMMIDEGLRKEMGERGRSRVVEHFSEDGMIGSYAELFHTLLGTGMEGRGNSD